MRLSTRIRRFHALVREGFYKPSEELEALLLNRELVLTPERSALTRLARLAALRILAGRDQSGSWYSMRKRNVRERLGLLRTA